MNLVNEGLNIFGYEFEEDTGVLRIKATDSRDKILELPETINGHPLKIIGTGLFSGKRIDTLTLPAQLERIGASAFSGCNLKEVTVSRNCTHIDYYAFGDNPHLKRIVLPPSVKFIDEDVFADTNHYFVTVCQEGSYAQEYTARDGSKMEVLNEEEFNKLYEL